MDGSSADMCTLQLTGCMKDSDRAGICGVAENQTAIERSVRLRVVCADTSAILRLLAAARPRIFPVFGPIVADLGAF